MASGANAICTPAGLGTTVRNKRSDESSPQPANMSPGFLCLLYFQVVPTILIPSNIPLYGGKVSAFIQTVLLARHCMRFQRGAAMGNDVTARGESSVRSCSGSEIQCLRRSPLFEEPKSNESVGRDWRREA